MLVNKSKSGLFTTEEQIGADVADMFQLGYRFEAFKNWAPVLLRHRVRFFLAGVVVLLEREDGLAPSLGQLVCDRVVILGLVLAATHWAPVRGPKELLGLDRKDLPLVFVSLALPFTLPGDRAAHLPTGLHIRAVHILLDQRWVSQCLPDGIS